MFTQCNISINANGRMKYGHSSGVSVPYMAELQTIVRIQNYYNINYTMPPLTLTNIEEYYNTL